MSFEEFSFSKSPSEDIYFIEPNQKYFDSNSKEFIDEINKYSYGYTDKFAMCRVFKSQSHLELKSLHISHFNNYVREFYTKNKQRFTNDKYKGLGKLLLKNILHYLLLQDSTIINNNVYLEMVNIKNKKLVQFYKDLSFTMIDEDNFSSTIKNVLEKLTNYPIIF